MKPFLREVIFLKFSRILGLITKLNSEEKIVDMDVLGDATFLYESSVESTLIEAVKNNWLINALVLDENGYSRIIKAEIQKQTCTVETTK